MIKKKVAILGSTGSIGTQALTVIKEHPSLFEVEVLTAGSNASLLIEQALFFLPKVVVITDKQKFTVVREALADKAIEVLCGDEALVSVVQRAAIDVVLTALVGFVGLAPTIAAIKAGKTIALANKETLVVAGELIRDLAKAHQVAILPVDSEHSAIFQCLVGEKTTSVEKIYLTASGGPFLGKDLNYLTTITKHEALKHPNWVMGKKITIDSASLMNKGLEVIEAKWLFDLAVDQIEVIVHPQSIIHSLVQFRDGSIKAQMGLPDMKLPIQYALAYPDRLANSHQRFSFLDYPTLSFEKPDLITFGNLALAYSALKVGGNMPCVLNAANEEVVAAFLNDAIGFVEMTHIIEAVLQKIAYIDRPKFEDLIQTDQESRIMANELVTKKKKIYQIEK